MMVGADNRLSYSKSDRRSFFVRGGGGQAPTQPSVNGQTKPDRHQARSWLAPGKIFFVLKRDLAIIMKTKDVSFHLSFHSRVL